MDKENNFDDLEKIVEEHNFLVLSKVFFEQIIQLLSSLAGLFFLAYIMGWVRVKSYYSKLGADWLLDDISTSTMLSHSIYPLAILATTFILYIVNTADKYTNLAKLLRTYKLSLFIAATLSLLSHLVANLNRSIVFQLLLAGAFIFWAIVSASGFCVLLLSWKNNRLKWSSSLVWGILVLLFFTLYHLPKTLGENEAEIQIQNHGSSFATVILHNSKEPDWKLLFTKNNFLYLIKFDSLGNARFKITPSENIEQIYKNKK